MLAAIDAAIPPRYIGYGCFFVAGAARGLFGACADIVGPVGEVRTKRSEW